MSTFFLHNSEIYGYQIDTSIMSLSPQNVITFNIPGVTSVNGVPIGNTSPNTGAFTSLSITGSGYNLFSTTQNLVHSPIALAADANSITINDVVNATQAAAPVLGLTIYNNISGAGTVDLTGHNVGLEVQVNNSLSWHSLIIGIEVQNSNTGTGIVNTNEGFLCKLQANAGTINYQIGYTTLFGGNTGTIGTLVDYQSPVYVGGGTVGVKYSFWGMDPAKTFLHAGPISGTSTLNITGATALAALTTSGTTTHNGVVNINSSLNVSSGAVNYFTLTGAATGSAPAIVANGTDTDIGINVFPKGAGSVSLGSATGNTVVNGRLTASGVLNLKAYTVATLPAAATAGAGAIAYVTDATTPTYRGALVGSGAVKCMVFCDGATWVSS